MSEKLVCDQKIGFVLALDFGLTCDQMPRKTVQLAGTASQVSQVSFGSQNCSLSNSATTQLWAGGSGRCCSRRVNFNPLLSMLNPKSSSNQRVSSQDMLTAKMLSNQCASSWRTASLVKHSTPLSDSEVGTPLPIEAARCSAVPLDLLDLWTWPSPKLKFQALACFGN